MKNNNLISIIFLLLVTTYACGGGEDSIDTPTVNQEIIPSNLTLNIQIVGLSQNTPNGDGSGQIKCTASATNAVKYGFRFNNGSEQTSSNGVIDYTFNQDDLNNHSITVIAYSDTDNSISTNQNVEVFFREGDLKLIWSDEFSTNGAINSSNWFHQTQLPAGGSWFNGEMQHYTNRIENSFVENGHLNIVAKKENFTDQGFTKAYTSVRLNSKFAFTYGRVDVRAKLPIEAGTWPAIWMLGKNINEDGAYWDASFGAIGWPACGEIDIMEHGIFPTEDINFIQSALHTPSSSGNTFNKGGIVVTDVENIYHRYSVNWSPDQITFLIDDVVFYTYSPTVKDDSTWPFYQDQYILLNIAMGGIAGTIDPTFIESSMVIDYVRVFQ